MERRKFLNGAGLIGGLLGGVFVGKRVVEHVHTKETIVKELVTPAKDIANFSDQPDGMTHLTLQGFSKKPKPIPSDTPYIMGIQGHQSYDKKVDLSVGLDNRLWMRVDGVWHRVSVDALNYEA